MLHSHAVHHVTRASRAALSRAQRQVTSTVNARPCPITGPADSTTAAQEYVTLASPVRLEVEVKKSRFIVTAWPVDRANQALQKIQQASDPSASHNCWAYRIGPAEFRSSDDGEPGGTAGRPILSAIEGEELQGVAVLVTRHFGGVKLGAGGLVRAYGGAARDCLRAASRVTVRARTQLDIATPYEFLGPIHNLLDKYECERLSEEWDSGSGADGLLMRISVDAAAVDELCACIADASAGRVHPKRCSPDAEAASDAASE